MKTKICSKCLGDLPITDFRKRLNKKKDYSYFRSWCRFCERVAALEYYRLNREHIKRYAAEYRRLNKEKTYIRKRLYLKNNPWAKTSHSIWVRVKKQYKKLGIKNYLTTQALRFLWFRDKAFSMKKPSIHRIDSLGNYTLKNCKYMESREHTILHNHRRQMQPRTTAGVFAGAGVYEQR